MSQSDYRKYSNKDLHDMIEDLFNQKKITPNLKEKFEDAIFKRCHEKLSTDEERKEAQKRNALQYYYRKKLINLHQEI